MSCVVYDKGSHTPDIRTHHFWCGVVVEVDPVVPTCDARVGKRVEDSASYNHALMNPFSLSAQPCACCIV